MSPLFFCFVLGFLMSTLFVRPAFGEAPIPKLNIVVKDSDKILTEGDYFLATQHRKKPLSMELLVVQWRMNLKASNRGTHAVLDCSSELRENWKTTLAGLRDKNEKKVQAVFKSVAEKDKYFHVHLLALEEQLEGLQKNTPASEFVKEVFPFPITERKRWFTKKLTNLFEVLYVEPHKDPSMSKKSKAEKTLEFKFFTHVVSRANSGGPFGGRRASQPLGTFVLMYEDWWMKAHVNELARSAKPALVSRLLQIEKNDPKFLQRQKLGHKLHNAFEEFQRYVYLHTVLESMHEFCERNV